MREQLINNKVAQVTSLAILFGSIILQAVTGNYLFFALPFAFLFFILTTLNWKVAYWCLLFSIPLSMQLSFLGNNLSTSLPDEPLMWMFLLLFLFMLANNPRVVPLWFFKNPLTLIVTLQLLWLIVAVTFSDELFISVKFLLAKCWFLTSFFILPVFIFREKKDFKTGFFLLLFPMLMTVVFIMMRHSSLGFQFKTIEKAISGIYYNHVEYSTVISMFFPVICIAYGLMKKERWWVRLIVLSIILFFLVAIYLTYARAAMLGVIFSYGIYLAIRLRLVNWVMPFFYGAIALIVVYMVHHNKYIDYRPNYDKTYTQPSFGDLIVATFRGEDMSSMERLYRWIAAVRMSTDRPVTGYGPNSFYYHYKPYAVSSFRTYVSRNNERSTTHNYFLFMLVGQGWPAMLLYGILVMVVFAQAQKIYYRFKDRFYKKVTLALAMMFAVGFINNFFSELIETHKVGALFFLCISLLIVLDRKSRQIEADEIIR